MIKKRSGKLLFLPLFVFLVGAVLGEFALAQVAGPAAEPVSPKLTTRLQELLRQEMLSINKASQEILAALVAGDDEHVATLAQQIHDSFILRQSMTPEDKAHLMAVVPDDFVKMDREFHEISAKLAQAARASNRPLQEQHFGRMINACTACHARYATDRFAGFAE